MTSDHDSAPPAEQFDFDLIIIGGGSGNTIISRALSHLRIALIDNGDHFGGTCLNAGCIPTKMFVHVADVAADARDSAGLGLDVTGVSARWSEIRTRVFTRTDYLSEAGFRNRDMKIPNVTVFRESVRFESAHVLLGDSGRRISGTRVVIAAGSRPRQLETVHGPVTVGGRIHDSNSIMRIETLPKSLVIIGGGAVAVEFAHIFSALGVNVTQVVRGPHLLGQLDRAIAERFTELASTQWRVVTGATVTRLADRSAVGLSAVGLSAVELSAVELSDGQTLFAEAVLVAIGRVPNSETLGLAAAGFDLHADGRLSVDSQQRVLVSGTALEGFFGLGDVSSPWQLKHVANHEARIVQHNLLNPTQLIGGEPGPVPAAIFSRPQVAYFGLTAEQAPDAVAISRDYSSTAWGWSLEDTTSFCRLVVAADTGLILGAHIIGPEASILIQPLVLAASQGLSVMGLARSMYWPHPAASEVIENALLDAESAVLARANTAHEESGPR